MKKHILVIEDDRDIAELLQVQLEIAGNKVTVSENGSEAERLIADKNDFSLFMIDWMIPGTSGVEICKQIRKNPQTQNKPVIMVTALTQPENIIEALDSGADDYVTKPFDMTVLLARVRAQLRRVEQEIKDEFEHQDLSISFTKCKVKVSREEVQLTNTEYQILSMLAEKPGNVFTREQLISNIQGENVFVTNRTVDTHVAGLRKKLKHAGSYIETIRGIGYRFADAE